MLFFALERVNVVEDIVMIGYEGPTRLSPEISILDAHEPTAPRATDRRALRVENVFIEGQDRPERRRGPEPAPRPADRRREQIVAPEIEGEYYFRTYASHAPVPYREDYVILRMVTPEYPPLELANGREGSVLVEAYIGADGVVNEVFVRNASGARAFEESAVTAVRQFLFKPVMDGGRPVSFWVSFLVRFRLNR